MDERGTVTEAVRIKEIFMLRLGHTHELNHPNFCTVLKSERTMCCIMPVI